MIPSHLTPQLASAANIALDHVLRTGAPGQSRPTGEVGFVAAVVVGGVLDLAAAWRPILGPAGYSVQISGVFCHQNPMASFIDSSGNQGSCELADLLVVVEDFTSGRRGRRWAVLIQAKMAVAGGGKTLSSLGDRRQLELLSTWPAFTLPASFAPGARDFSICGHGGTLIDCGRYGLIAGQPNPLWHQQAPAAAIPAGGDELGTFLAHMVEAGQTSYGREATGLGDDWSRTVDELMTRTYASAFTYAAGFPGPQNRGQSALAFTTSLAPFRFDHGDAIYMDGAPPSGGRDDSLSMESLRPASASCGSASAGSKALNRRAQGRANGRRDRQMAAGPALCWRPISIERRGR